MGHQKASCKVIGQWNKVVKGFFILANLFVGVVFMVTFIDVVMRYFFNKPFHWSQELVSLMLVYMTFSAAAEILRMRGHITCDLLYCKFPVKVQHKVDNLVYGCMVVFCSVISWQAFEASMLTYNLNIKVPSLLGTPLFIPYGFIFLGSVCLALQALLELMQRLSTKQTNHG